MTNNTPSSPQPDRQTHMIDVLLAENAFLKLAITALMPGGKGLSETELAFVKTMTGNYGGEISNPHVQEGNNQTIISDQHTQEGNKETGISNQQVMARNYPFNISNLHSLIGNNATSISNQPPQPGINVPQLTIVQENVRRLMKTAILSLHLTTARILVQLSLNPATPLHDLRKLTGLSEDGMAKRIMAMKKAGLIVKLSAPKRFLLTEKAKALFIKIWR